jgi:beta-glucanase (GH16 family)
MDAKLCLFTKNEHVTAPAWDPKKGFINKDFEYTSDIIQTADAFRQKEGMFMVKLRTEGDIHHAVWLGSGKKLPMISLFHFNGKRITMGNYKEKGFDGTTLSGISPTKYYIYTLRWTERELIWFVNNLEVYRTSYNLPKEPLFLALSSFIDEQQKAMEGTLNVAWIRVYKHVK